MKSPDLIAKILRLAADGIARAEIAKRLGLAWYDVRNVIVGSGHGELLPKTRVKSDWLHLYEAWRSAYVAGESTRQIADRYGANTMSVRIAIRGLERHPRRVVVANERYFYKINSGPKAYFLGLLVADGCIHDYDHREWMVSLGLTQEDRFSDRGNERDLVLAFRDAVGSDGGIGPYPKKLGRPGHVYRTFIPSPIMAMDLQMHGVFPRKSDDKIGIAPALVPIRFVADFARGLLDGDGSIELAYSGVAGWERRPYWDNSLNILLWLRNGLRSLGIIHSNAMPRMGHDTYRLQLCGHDAKRAIEAMYRDKTGPRLLRKWKRAHLHPLEWEDFKGNRARLPPLHQQKRKTGPKPGTTRKFDYEAIVADRKHGMSYDEIGRKHRCSRIVVLRACRNLPRTKVYRRP